MKYEIFVNGSVFIDTENEEDAVSQALEFINENAKDYCEIRIPDEDNDTEN